jgi:hypothetical protein
MDAATARDSCGATTSAEAVAGRSAPVSAADFSSAEGRIAAA